MKETIQWLSVGVPRHVVALIVALVLALDLVRGIAGGGAPSVRVELHPVGAPAVSAPPAPCGSSSNKLSLGAWAVSPLASLTALASRK